MFAREALVQGAPTPGAPLLNRLADDLHTLAVDLPGDAGGEHVALAFLVLWLALRMALFYVVPKGTWWTVVKDEEELGLFSHEEQARKWARAWASVSEDSSVVALDHSSPGALIELD
jgi:hypothetical protein